MTENFKVGDVVTLKSGGPKMTVAELRKTVPFQRGDVASYTGKVKCTWFVNDVSSYESFDQDAIELVQD